MVSFHLVIKASGIPEAIRAVGEKGPVRAWTRAGRVLVSRVEAARDDVCSAGQRLWWRLSAVKQILQFECYCTVRNGNDGNLEDGPGRSTQARQARQASKASIKAKLAGTMTVVALQLSFPPLVLHKVSQTVVRTRCRIELIADDSRPVLRSTSWTGVVSNPHQTHLDLDLELDPDSDSDSDSTSSSSAIRTRQQRAGGGFDESLARWRKRE